MVMIMLQATVLVLLLTRQAVYLCLNSMLITIVIKSQQCRSCFRFSVGVPGEVIISD